MHAEAVLLVDNGQRQIVERDVFLKERMRADDEIDIARRQRRENLRALAAALAAGEDGEPDAGGGGERRDGRKMLARQNFRRRHEGGLAAGLDHGRGGEQSDERLAGTDVAVQQPQHAVGLRQIGDDVGDRALLRRRERIGERSDDALAQASLGGAAAAGPYALVSAEKRERQLTGEQFVVSKPRPGRTFRPEVVGRRRTMQAAQGVGKARKSVALEPGRVLPFRQRRHAIEREVDRLAQLVGMQPFGERIDRVDQRQMGKACCIDHAVGMQHLQMAVVQRRGARNITQLALGKKFLQIVAPRVEIGDGERVGLVAGVDVVGRPRPVRRRRPVAIDGDGDGHHRIGLDLGELGLVAPIDETGRQVKQQIDDPRPFALARQEVPE